MPCPDPIAGSITNETGPLTGLVDAYSKEEGVPFHHYFYAILTNKPGACAHFRSNQIVASEAQLLITQIAWNPDNSTPAPWTTAMPLDLEQEAVGADGTHYTLQARWATHTTRCKATWRDATSGTVSYTQADSSVGVAGHYDLWFGSDHLTGDFVAPVCVQCVPRPTSVTCVSS